MESGRIPVIIDSDPGVDDVIALLLALASPELDILAIVLSFGNTDVEASRINILKLYEAIRRHNEQCTEHQTRFPNFVHSRPILAIGSHGPLEGALHSAQYFHGRDGLGDIAQRYPDIVAPDVSDVPQLQATDKSGIDIAFDFIRDRPARSITYMALGPLTNLAQIVRKDPKMVHQRIGRVVCMGGALNVPGNTSPVAEFNFFADPFAVKELLVPTRPGGGLPLDRFLLMPLDITTPHELPFDVYRAKVDPDFETVQSHRGKTPVTQFTSAFLERTREVMLQFGKDAMELHDIVAVWCAIANPPQADGERFVLAPGWAATGRAFDIERVGELTRGMCVVDRRADEGAYEIGANRADAHGKKQKAEEDAHHVPALVETEERHAMDEHPPKVVCITATPGPKALLQLLLRRVWGVESVDA
ncbi:Inosine/uridine-preferring nucleoside hydrolase domain-containing protein [Schizophyllum amplum]|uniref:Inosine/uridine-preferring nucleoside hydrolase domain-containing protein n=1 Tax=Schizophyllum amplum TaxID=97359 RepID=A0A550CYE6_9AGAR|nr:Inosine/uridine-preferring nucleoside hydrolase domain-containing protein [Auriculariopsis ampla]